jgi:hypothetical protein
LEILGSCGGSVFCSYKIKNFTVAEDSATGQCGAKAMVVKVDKHGNRIHSPPYSKAEEDEFYRRVGRGPITVARPAGDRAKQTSPEQQQPSPAKPARAELENSGQGPQIYH